MSSWKEIFRVSMNFNKNAFIRKTVRTCKTRFIKKTPVYFLTLGIGAVASENKVKLEVMQDRTVRKEISSHRTSCHARRFFGFVLFLQVT